MVKKTENKPKSDKKPMSFSEMAKKPGAPQSKAVINMKYSDKGVLKFIIRSDYQGIPLQNVKIIIKQVSIFSFQFPIIKI